VVVRRNKADASEVDSSGAGKEKKKREKVKNKTIVQPLLENYFRSKV